MPAPFGQSAGGVTEESEEGYFRRLAITWRSSGRFCRSSSCSTSCSRKPGLQWADEAVPRGHQEWQEKQTASRFSRWAKQLEEHAMIS